MSSKIEYTCKGKGGRYEILGLATGAGLTRGEDRLIYKDASTGRLFLRTESDFSDRMERLQDVAAPVVERQPVALITEAPDCIKPEMRPAWIDGWNSARTAQMNTAPPELAELQATIANLTTELKVTKQALGSLKGERDELQSELERLKGGQGEPVAWKITFTYSDQLYCIDLTGEQAVELSNNPYYKVVPLYEAQPKLAPVGFVAHRLDEIGQSFEGVIYASAILGGLVEQGTLLYTRDNSTSTAEDKS